MSHAKTQRPRLALPFTILTEADHVRLLAGEDLRYHLTGHGLERWLPGLLAGCTGRFSVEELLVQVGEEDRPAAKQLLERLYGERVLVNGTPVEAHAPGRYRLVIEGIGLLAKESV
jgi:hypothetical protein